MTARNPLKPGHRKILLPVVGLVAAALSTLYATEAHAQSPTLVQSLTAAATNLEFEAPTNEIDGGSRVQSFSTAGSSLDMSASLQNVMQDSYSAFNQDRFCNGQAWINPYRFECVAERLLPYLYLFLPLCVLVVVVKATKQSR